MAAKLSSRLLVALSIAYGIVMAVLGAFGSPATGPVALIGALVIGGLWAVRAMPFGNRDRSS